MFKIKELKNLMCSNIKGGKFFKLCAITILVSLLLLLAKGFTYALPNISPHKVKVASLKRNIRNFTCPLPDENYSVIKDCTPCTKYQMKFEKECLFSGNVEQLQCFKSEKLFMLSCPFSIHAEAKKFWAFEGCIISIGLLSNLFVLYRRRSNDSHMYQRLKRQISDADECV